MWGRDEEREEGERRGGEEGGEGMRRKAEVTEFTTKLQARETEREIGREKQRIGTEWRG